ncbi:Uncharacterized protein GBIM_02600 [Gryllus bimaculatus]|nr:Uncharacterized protein GBIM_02600 [Gryllus bimaculatus]
MVVFSKLTTTTCTCREYVHPWTNSCTAATAGLGYNASKQSLRIYVTVYVLAMLMRGKIPTLKDLKSLILRISQSTAFLTCHASSYSLILCCIRYIFGGFNVFTASFVPSFLASYVSILVERPSRRGLLTLYVTNVASETLFRMAVWRGLVRPIPHGEIAIFAMAVAGILYKMKSKEKNKDSVFGLLRYIVGPWEEKKSIEVNDQSSIRENVDRDKTNQQKGIINMFFNKWFKIFIILWNKFKTLKKHRTCEHPFSCVHYVTQGSLKLFSVGYSLQVCLKLLLQMKRIVKNPKLISRCLFHRDALRFGAFLGGFSGLFRVTSCLLRWLTDCNSACHSIPAGLVAGLSFTFFPDVTIALYLLWKWVELMYSDGVEKGYFPELPGATILLYCTSTAVLFHAALLEPNNLRPSYWKFLHRISGGWIVTMDRKPMDVFGLESSSSLARVLKETGTNYLLYPHFG